MISQSQIFDFSSSSFLLLVQERLAEIDEETDELFFSSSLQAQHESKSLKSVTISDQVSRFKHTRSSDEDCWNISENTGVPSEQDENEGEDRATSRIEEMAELVTECAKDRNKIRLDEISKRVVRKLFKEQKTRFINHVKMDQPHHLPQATELQASLVLYLTHQYGISRQVLQGEQLVIAKSIFYNFIARRQDDTLGTSEKEKMLKSRIAFCERGTKKQAESFFSSTVAQNVIYPVFRGTLLHLTQVRGNGALLSLKRTIKKFLTKLEAVITP